MPFFRDDYDRLVLWQRPNWQIMFAGFFGAVAYIVDDGIVKDVFTRLSLLALVYWALLEVAKGDSGFRRLLGAGAIAILAYMNAG